MIRRRSTATVAVLGVSIFVLVVAADADDGSAAGPAFLSNVVKREIIKSCEKIFYNTREKHSQIDRDRCYRCCKRAGLPVDRSKNRDRCRCVKPPSKLSEMVNQWLKNREERLEVERKARRRNSAKGCTDITLDLPGSNSLLEQSQKDCTSCCARFGVEEHTWKKSKNPGMECHCGSQGCSLKQWLAKTSSAVCGAEGSTRTESPVSVVE
jgi:hypothetical protein